MHGKRSVPRPGRRGYRLLAGLGAGIVVFLVVRVLTSPGPNVLDGTPTEILGRWTTDDSRYRDRAFHIEDDTFHLEVGPDSILSYRIARIQRFGDDGFDRYVVTYYTREGEVQQEFRLFPDGVLRLKNPPDLVWTR